VRKVAQNVFAAEVHQELEALVEHLVRPGVRPIDLVYHDDWLQPTFERLGEHIARLRHRPFRGVHEDQRPIRHPQHALHLPAKIGVPWRIDEIDLHALVVQRNVLCQDGDPALPLQVVRIQNALTDKLARPELATLAQQAIHERGLAVVQVGDNGDIANVGAAHCGNRREKTGSAARRNRLVQKTCDCTPTGRSRIHHKAATDGLG
jgi:hypothetical protein